MSNEQALATDFLQHLRAEFAHAREIAERAIAQMPEQELHWVPDERSNSVAMLMKHIGGNLRSRFTDMLTTDGEKPDRHRETEFENDGDLAALKSKWDTGWSCLEQTVAALRPEDLGRQVTIRDEPHTVVQALLRILGHCHYHAGQIVELARMRTDHWDSLSRPRKDPA